MPETSSKELHIEAEALLDRQDLAGARMLYVRLCELAPDDAEAWMMLGLIDSDTGSTATALSALRTALAHDPHLVEAHFNLAYLLANAGDTETALNHCMKAVEIDGDYTEAWMLLGIIHGKGQRFESAASCFREVLARDSDSGEAIANLGLALTNSGQYDEARQFCTRAVQIFPRNILLWLALGDIHVALGNKNEAITAYQRATELELGNQRALQSLAELWLEQGQPDKSADACRALLALDSADVVALSVIGTVHQLRGNLHEAVKYLNRAVDLQPENAANNYKLACACQSLGELDRALAYFNRTLELEAGSATAIAGLVRVHEQKGNVEEVKRLLPALIEAADRDPLVLPTLASVASKFGVADICLEKLLLTLNTGNVTDTVRSRLHWATGMLYDRLGNFNAAFEHHMRSKALAGGYYDTGAHSDFIDRIISVFSRDALEAAPKPSRHSELPVFIVGMPRSGTSLVEQILASHGQVFGAGERDTMARIAQSLPARLESRRRYPECIPELKLETLDAAAADYLKDLLDLPSSVIRATDKMPHNFLHLGLIQLLFPGARIVHVKRDPLDTCVSCFFQEFSNAHAYARNLDDLGAHYRDYERLMDHWRRALRIPMMDLQYEELVTEPERVMRGLIEFCGLPWDPACAEFYKTDRVVATLSASQVREPLNRKSIGRWKQYEKHLGPLLRHWKHV